MKPELDDLSTATTTQRQGPMTFTLILNIVLSMAVLAAVLGLLVCSITTERRSLTRAGS
jgi:hypothetical protein